MHYVLRPRHDSILSLLAPFQLFHILVLLCRPPLNPVTPITPILPTLIIPTPRIPQACVNVLTFFGQKPALAVLSHTWTLEHWA